MKKNALFAPTLFAAGILLAGCGTADLAGEETDTEPAETAEEESSETNQETETVEEPDEETEGGSGDEHGETPEGELTMSDNQSYQLYVLDGYGFTAEEPNRDVIFLQENDAVFMRVETYYPNDINFDELASNTQDTVQASNPDGELAEFTGYDSSAFNNSAAYEVETAEGNVTGIAFESDNIVVRVTIFDHSTVGARDDFIQMAQTIERVQK
ncbi:hypothetical protein [Planococcus maitriensis]|uniref:Uncharacterized protein n=2 Tax=Planococcus TaxID=1372 RepID=A0A365KAX6_9BACL|nr:hypothetical protein [Planococcus maitriensis]RAZ69922.1 hypothetical protein DP119_04475 [Planococcus maitriensis]